MISITATKKSNFKLLGTPHAPLVIPVYSADYGIVIRAYINNRSGVVLLADMSYKDLPKKEVLEEIMDNIELNFSPQNNHFAFGLKNSDSFVHIFHMLEKGPPFYSGMYKEFCKLNDLEKLNWNELPSPVDIVCKMILDTEKYCNYEDGKSGFWMSLMFNTWQTKIDNSLLEVWPECSRTFYVYFKRSHEENMPMPKKLKDNLLKKAFKYISEKEYSSDASSVILTYGCKEDVLKHDQQIFSDPIKYYVLVANRFSKYNPEINKNELDLLIQNLKKILNNTRSDHEISMVFSIYLEMNYREGIDKSVLKLLELWPDSDEANAVFVFHFDEISSTVQSKIVAKAKENISHSSKYLRNRVIKFLKAHAPEEELMELKKKYPDKF